MREYEATQRALRDIAEAERIRRDTERALLFASASPSTQGPPGRNLVAEVTATAIALKELEDAAGIARDTFLQQLAVNAVPSTQGPPGRDLEVEAESTAGALRDLAAAAAIARDTMIAQRLAEAGPTVQGPPGRDLELEARETAAAIQQIAADSVAAQDILLDTARSLVASGASALELRAALEALSRAGVELPRDLEEVALALLSVSDAAGRVGRGVGAPPAPAGPRLIIDPFGDLPQRGRELAEAGKEAGGKIAEMAEQARLAGVDFRQAIVIAGAQFTASLIQDIQSGNIAGAFRSAFGVAGQVAGAGASFLQSGGLSFLGLGASAIPGLQLVAGLLPVFGSIVSGMLGQQARSASDVERARGVTPRGASSISLSFNFYQSLALASLTDPESRAALRGSALEAFEQFRRLLEVNVLPRLDRLEARA